MDSQILQQLDYSWAKYISPVFTVAIQFSILKQPIITAAKDVLAVDHLWELGM